jgi:hypothetical protein
MKNKLLILIFSLIATTSCKKKFNWNQKTPVGAVESYIWAVNKKDCSLLEKAVADRFLKYVKKGKNKCHSIIVSYSKEKGANKVTGIKIEPKDGLKVFYQKDNQAIITALLRRKGKDSLAYFDLLKIEDKWFVVGEDMEKPKWYISLEASKKDVKVKETPDTKKNLENKKAIEDKKIIKLENDVKKIIEPEKDIKTHMKTGKK